MLEWQLREIAKCRIDEVVVVTGYGADKVEAILQRVQQPPVRSLYNPFYANCDNLGTCWVARPEMTDDFVLINGDTLFEAEVLARLLDTPAAWPVTLVTDRKTSYDDDDMKVAVEGERLLRVGKRLSADTVTGESIGMMALRRSGPALMRRRLDDIVRRDEGLDRWYLTAIDELAGEGHVGVCSAAGLSWCEIDDRADLAVAERLVATWSQPEHWGRARA